jgi:16S rRNA (uracil1498-N3)-methyltransferase
LPQLLVKPDQIHSSEFTVEGPEAHHLLRVLRKKVGDEIEFTDGCGHRFVGKLDRVDADFPRASGIILTQLTTKSRPCTLRLFQGLPKGAKFDYVIEKATELGVDEIHPFLSAKNPIKLTAAQASAKVGRWEKLGVAAAKQSRRNTIPIISSVRELTDLKDELSQGITIIFWENEKVTPLKEIVSTLSGKNTVNIVIGSESGLLEKEVELMKTWGGKTVSLGERILRTETVGLAVLSILNYELGLF